MWLRIYCIKSFRVLGDDSMSTNMILLGIIATSILVITLGISLKKRIFKGILRRSNILNNKKNKDKKDKNSILEVYDYLKFDDLDQWHDED